MYFIFLFACNSASTGKGSNGVFGLIKYHYKDDRNVLLSSTKLISGYEHDFSTSLTRVGEELYGENSEMIYHVSPDDLNILTFDDGNPPGFSASTNNVGTFAIESKFRDELVDRIYLDFVIPDEIATKVWIREPNTNTFTDKEGSTISVPLYSQATFVPIPKYEGNEIVGEIDYELSIEPPEAVVTGHNIDNVNHDYINTTPSPINFYFIQTGTVSIGLTESVNNITTWQEIVVE